MRKLRCFIFIVTWKYEKLASLMLMLEKAFRTSEVFYSFSPSLKFYKLKYNLQVNDCGQLKRCNGKSHPSISFPRTHALLD